MASGAASGASLAAGGAAGGVFVALVAPAVFPAYLELHIGILGCCLLTLAVLFRDRKGGLYRGRPRWAWASLVLAIAALATALGAQAGQSLDDALALTRNFYGVLRVEEIAGDDPERRQIKLMHGRILHGVQFVGPDKRREPTAYYGRESGVIDGLTLTVKPAEKIGLIGRSGAGKSTVVNLLLRFFDLEGGRILIDGQDIAAVTQESLRDQISVVTQDTSLLHRSIGDNIRYGRPQATEAEVVAAAKLAHAHEFILELEDWKQRRGYAAQVGERGVKLSGGQRQRIAIARVILKDAPILVLDEATSALDSEVEAAIQSSLGTLMAGKTVIAIAHRLSTIARMDRLIVLDHGRIVEQGSHDELLRCDGHYAALWRHQSGGFIDAGGMQAAE